MEEFCRKQISILNKKNLKDFNVSGIKDKQHWKKISSKKEKVWETWPYPKLNVKYRGYHTLSLLKN